MLWVEPARRARGKQDIFTVSPYQAPALFVCRNALSRLLTAVLVLVVLSLAAGGPARAADSGLFVVTGVPVDVRAATAAAAKKQALGDVQITAFKRLAQRLGGPSAASQVAGYDIKIVGTLLRSLSIEEEHTAPGRYFGKLTVRFLPAMVRQLFTRAGIGWTEARSGRIVVVPLWKGPDGPILWDDNPWRQAWVSLGAQNGLVPILIPLGDLTDAQSLTLDDALSANPAALDALRTRYQGQSILVAVAEPAGDNSVHVKIEGPTPLGAVLFDKTYSVDKGGVAAAAETAAQRFQDVLDERWRAGRASSSSQAPVARTVVVAVPFNSQDEWNMIRSGLVATPGVAGADITSLAQGGAMVSLAYTVPFETLQASLYQRRLSLQRSGNGWLLQPF